MVYRRRRYVARKRAYRKKSTYRRRKAYRRRRSARFARPRGNVLFPSKRRIVLRYCEDFTGSTTSLTGIQFRANSLYDPYYTGTGHQPRGFDQMAAFYNAYEVISCRYRVVISVPNSNRVINATTDIMSQYNPAMKFWVTHRATTTLSGNRNDLDEWPRVKARVVAPGNVGTIKGVIYNRTYERDPSRRIASIDANPAAASIINVSHAPDQSSFTGVIYAYTVILDYLCEFSQPIEIGQS